MKNGILLISLAAMLAVSMGLVGCGGGVPGTTEYTLTISSTDGGLVTSPGEGIFAYDERTDVTLVARTEMGYRFVNWVGDVDSIADINTASTTITMSGNYSILANFCEIPVTYHFEEGEMTIPNPNVGSAIRGDMGEKGYIFPSDLQRHTFFSGTT